MTIKYTFVTFITAFTLLLSSCSKIEDIPVKSTKASELASRLKSRLQVAGFDQRMVKIITNGALSNVYTPVNIGRSIVKIKSTSTSTSTSNESFTPPTSQINTNNVYDFFKYMGQGFISALGDSDITWTVAQKNQVIDLLLDECSKYLNGNMLDLNDIQKARLFYDFVYRMIGSISQAGIKLNANQLTTVSKIVGLAVKGLKNVGESNASIIKLLQTITKAGAKGVIFAFKTNSSSSQALRAHTIKDTSIDLNEAIAKIKTEVTENINSLPLTKAERSEANTEATKGLSGALKENEDEIDVKEAYLSQVKSDLQYLQDEEITLADTRDLIFDVSENAIYYIDDIGADYSEYADFISNIISKVIEGMKQDNAFNSSQIASACDNITHGAIKGLLGIENLSSSDILNYSKQIVKGAAKKLNAAGLSTSKLNEATAQITKGASNAFKDSELSDLFEEISEEDFQNYIRTGESDGLNAGGGYLESEISDALDASTFAIVEDESYEDANESSFPSSFPDLDDENEENYTEEEE
ncbi:MAG: hypothetical protein HQK49_06270 [Oligoflexia bacterium]|nr:hypothetical protein [Oligoflexia bacterium]